MSKSIDLLNFCQEEAQSTIECVPCGHRDIVLLEALEAIDEFYKLGWRIRKKQCYCPGCSKEFNVK